MSRHKGFQYFHRGMLSVFYFMRKTYFLASHLRWHDYISTLACQPTKPLIDFESNMIWEVNQGRAQFRAWIIIHVHKAFSHLSFSHL